MGPSRQGQNEDFESQVRAMLLRRAADVHPRRPPWETLSTESEGRVIPLTPGTGGRRFRGRPGPGWVRPAVAAASVLALVLVGTIVVDRAGRRDGQGDSGDPASEQTEVSDQASEVPRIPAPGNHDFVPAEGLPIYPLTDVSEEAFLSRPVEDLRRYEDPNLVAEEYLASVGITTESSSSLELRSSPARDALEETEVELMLEDAGVFWSFADDADVPVTRGNVFLRRSYVWGEGEEIAAEPWVVVGAMTFDLRLKDVRRDGDRLSFVVGRTEDLAGIDTVRVEVNGEVLEEGDVGRDDPQPFTYTVPSEMRDEPIVIRLQHLDPEPVSVTEMAVPADYPDAGDELDGENPEVADEAGVDEAPAP